jgi:ceramide glucosyltransferase
MTALVVTGTIYVLLLVFRAALAMGYSRTVPGNGQAELSAGSLTIAQPILSGDPLLESRLAANLMELPDQTFLWLVDEDDAEANRIADALCDGHPLVNLHVVRCPPCGDTTNPKLWKLRYAAAMVDTPYFCVLDDDTTLSSASAAALVAGAANHTVATGLPCYLDSGDMPSGLLSQFVNNNSVFTYLGTSRLLAPFTLNGMGYVMKSGELERLGNFESILNELTDDLAVATLVLEKGGSIHQSVASLRVQTGVENLHHYVNVMHRWYVFTLLLMRRQTLASQALIFVLHGFPPMLLIAFTGMALSAWNVSAALFWLVVLLLRAGVITSMHRRFLGKRLHRPLVSVVSEMIQPLHLSHALLCRTIRWRTRRYHVRDSNDFSSV